jgi:hypothetical protein
MLNKKLVIAALIACVPATTMAAAGQNNIGSCGWGSKVFDGQKGIVPQVLGATTNGTSGNQTFAITSGTSGCTQDGVVSSSWKMAMFIDGSKDRLARDMSTGSGESLDSLAALMGVKDADKPVFFRTLKEGFAQIFFSDSVTSAEVMASIKQVMAADSTLAQYASTI